MQEKYYNYYKTLYFRDKLNLEKIKKIYEELDDTATLVDDIEDEDSLRGNKLYLLDLYDNIDILDKKIEKIIKKDNYKNDYSYNNFFSIVKPNKRKKYSIDYEFHSVESCLKHIKKTNT